MWTVSAALLERAAASCRPSMLRCFLVSFALSAASMAPLIRASRAWGFQDEPDGGLKVHCVPTPVLGGVGIAFAVLCGFTLGQPDGERWVALLSIAMAHGALGLRDDRRGLNAEARLGAQLLAGVLVAMLGGGFVLEEVGASWLAAGSTVVATAALVNATNMLDGIDGLCGGCTLVSALGLGAALYGAGDASGALLAVALAGACAGFLPFNVQPARIFMGDSGSCFLGFILAILLFRLEQAAGLSGLLGGILCVAVPLLDASLTVARRAADGRSPLAGDRNHTYDRMIAHGLSVRLTVGLFWAAAALTTGGGIVVVLTAAGGGRGG